MKDYSEEIRRAGLERRKKIIEIPADQRVDLDKRDLLRRQQFIINKLKRIPIFQDLSDEQFKTILRISAKKDIQKDTVIYNEGDKSEDMFVLLEGVLQTSFRRKEICLITPIDIIGEMGMFTGEPRPAKITAKCDCTLIRINSIELFQIFERDPILQSRFQSGMIYSLSEKLKVTYGIIAKLKKQSKVL